MATTVRLTKWGNSQGVLIPKHLCDHLGLRIGDTVTISVDAATHRIELSQVPQKDASTVNEE